MKVEIKKDNQKTEKNMYHRPLYCLIRLTQKVIKLSSMVMLFKKIILYMLCIASRFQYVRLRLNLMTIE